MSLNAADLYALLPAIYRTRDAANGLPLQALMQVVAEQAGILEENIQQLYDDEFIETCADWVIPYIGDLVGATPVYEIDAAASGRRAEVANTIAYRRRKGTLLALEQVAMDVSGRPAVAVEYFKRLITTESMRHVRPRHTAFADLRRGNALDQIGGAFDTLSRTVDVRRIAPRVRAVADPDPTPLDIALHGGGKDNIPNVGVYLWRWKCNQVLRAPGFCVDARRYKFSCLGQDIPLFNLPIPHDSFSGLMTRADVPQPIGRREFFDDPGAFYNGSFEVFVDGLAVDVSQICCRDLSDANQGWVQSCDGRVAIDPELGRIQFGTDAPASREVRVSYCYGFPADIGGGPYNRTANLPAFSTAAFPFFVTVGSPATPTLQDAVDAWNLQAAGTTGLIVLPNFEAYDIDLTGAGAIQVPVGSALWIAAAQPGSVPVFSGACGLVRGNIEATGEGQLFINGIWIAGGVRVEGALSVQFSDCTLVPGISLTSAGLPAQPGEPSIVANTPGAAVSLFSAISGPIGVAEGATTRICSSIVDADSPCAVAYAAADFAAEGADLHIEDSTVIGKVHVRTMQLASNSIFMARRAKHDPWRAALWCSRKQSGCVRFCFVPADAITPRRYRCLPGEGQEEAALRPQFVTLRYGHPSYALLSGRVPMAIWTGADNGSQMGVYKTLEETEAVRNVQLRVPEFLPFNLEAGVFLEPSAAVASPWPEMETGYRARQPFHPCGCDTEDELWHVGVGAHLI
jgi:hypothetical protein